VNPVFVATIGFLLRHGPVNILTSQRNSLRARGLCHRSGPRFQLNPAERA